MTKLTLHPHRSSFPMVDLVETGLWAILSPSSRAVLGVLWEYHRRFPDACKPSRRLLAAESGVSEPTVTKAISELEARGFVEVRRAPGPGSNFYRVKWTDLVGPEASSSPGAGSPYRGGSSSHVLVPCSERRAARATTGTKAHLYRCPDGCVLRSAAELGLHQHLVAWALPHAANVKYSALGISVLDSKGNRDTRSTVDFVLGPKLLLEVVRQPQTQKGAERYNQKLRSKAEAAGRAGYRVIKFEAYAPNEESVVEPVLQSWADASLEDVRKFIKPIFDSFPKDSKLRIKQLVDDAKLRVAGERVPDEAHGVTRLVHRPPHPPSEERCMPHVVLMSGAGRLPDPPDPDGLLSGML